jgi:hypothetical protein
MRHSIVTFGPDRIREAIADRVALRYRYKLAGAGIIGWLRIHWRMRQIVERKMKLLQSPYAI